MLEYAGEGCPRDQAFGGLDRGEAGDLQHPQPEGYQREPLVSWRGALGEKSDVPENEASDGHDSHGHGSLHRVDPVAVAGAKQDLRPDLSLGDGQHVREPMAEDHSGRSRCGHR